MEEKEHLIYILNKTKNGLKTDNIVELQALSDQTIHSASVEQHTDYILIAVLIYTLAKLTSRKDDLKIDNWPLIVYKINKQIDNAIESIENDNESKFTEALIRIKKILVQNSLSLKTYVNDVLRKASINKASKIYEHGISLSQTARLLDLNKWELSEYIGQKEITEAKYNLTISIKKRVGWALKFFS